MEQHPIPQHIASYEFRLVGDMTLKQFGYLASGGVVALIFYAAPLPWYFKWPAVISFGFLGFALAFLPIQERPLNQWIMAFAKAIFAPTQYLWERKAKRPEVLQYTPPKTLVKKMPAPPPDKAQVSAYLQTLPSEATKSPVEQQEEKYLQQIGQLLQTPTKTIPYQPVFPPVSQGPQQAPVQPRIGLRPVPIAKPKPTPAKPFVRTVPRTIPSDAAMIRTGRKVILPEKPGQIRKQAVPAKTSVHLPFPAPPKQPNLLVGMLLDKNNEMIEGAIIEIRNSQGMPVRALKTNKLGQFRIATPLPTDTYEIETEKEGYQFDIIKITLKGEAVPPLEIRAK